MADQHLIPELKAETDRLYDSNPVKYQRLIVWVNQGRKYGWLEEDMAEALRRFWDHRNDIEIWHPYLDRILEKVRKDRQRDQVFQDHQRFKTELVDIWNKFGAKKS